MNRGNRSPSNLKSNDWKANLKRGENGQIKDKLINVLLVLTGAVGERVFLHDEFAHQDVYGMDTPWNGKRKAEIRDIDIILIKDWISRVWGFEPNNERINQAVSLIASRNKFHEIRDYLDGLFWDGKPRLDSWLSIHLGATGPSEYLAAVGRKTLIAMVGRILRPGCKFDHVLILEGPQGCGKSTAVKVLADPWFSDNNIVIGNKDTEIGMRSIWVIELGELSAMRKVDVNQLKQFISRSEDRIRLPYGKRAETFPRQCVFIGTTNSSLYLRDLTGNRRFWPVKVKQCDYRKLEDERDQLFAEAVIAWENREKLYLEDPAIAQMAISEQEARLPESQWQGKLSDYLAKSMCDGFDPKCFTMDQLFDELGPFANYKGEQHERMQVAEALKALGYENERRLKDGVRKTWWSRATLSETAGKLE